MASNTKTRKREGRSFGHRIKRKDTSQTDEVTCIYCDKRIEGCPPDLRHTREINKFLSSYDINHPCKPRHCTKCICSQCYGSDTASSTAATSAYGYSDSYSSSDISEHDCSLPSELESDCYSDIDAVGCNDPKDPDYSPNESTLDSTISEADLPKINSNMNEFRIMNLEQVSKHVNDVTLHASLCSEAKILAAKGDPPVKLLGEVQQLGMASFLHSTCQGCGKVFSFCTSPRVNTQNGDRFEVNLRAVWAQMSTGGGCNKLNEVTATLGMPGLDQRTFSKLENEIGHWWTEVLRKEMIAAGIEERRLAEEAGNYHEGVPFIKVVIDAGWSKESHKHSYNAPGGVGIVVAVETKKILDIRVKVKTCSICDVAEAKGVEPKEHECGKNWNASSQAMEAGIFLDAFSQCEQIHGVRYLHVIADGDSSVLPTLITQGPHWCRDIQKIECPNHCCKCLRSALEKLVEDKPHYKGKGRLTKLRIVKISAGVRCAIKMRSKQVDTIGKDKAIKLLQRDIGNSMWHVFGHHKNCSEDFCLSKSQGTQLPQNCNNGTCEKDNENDESQETQQPQASNDPCENDNENEDAEEDEEDILDGLIEMWQNVTNPDDIEASRTDCGRVDPLEGDILYDVSVILNRLVDKAPKLITNTTSNLAENWMGIRTKFDGGKKVNHCQRLAWHYRCCGAGLRRNLGTTWGAKTWEITTGRPASLPWWKFGKNQEKNLQRAAKSAAKPEVQLRAKKKKLQKQQLACSLKARKSYGPEVEELVAEDDISSDALKVQCSKFFTEKVKVTSNEAILIEKKTRLQSSSGVWQTERRKRLTASNFGEVMRRRQKTKVERLVRQLLYPTFKGNGYTTNGLREEDATFKDYEAMKSKETGKTIKIRKCGLYVSAEHPFLGASPDGVVTENGQPVGLIEVKNVLKNKPVTFEEQIKNNMKKKSKGTFCLKLDDNGKLFLSTSHNYFYQVHGQMNISGYSWVDFVIRSVNPYQIHIQRIHRDITLWNSMLAKLGAFYHTCLLPELAAPRKGKFPGIREPGVWFSQPEPTPAAKPKKLQKAIPKRSQAKPREKNTKKNETNVVTPSTSTERPQGLRRSLRVLKLNCDKQDENTSEGEEMQEKRPRKM